jgi:hypothetical protein
MPKASLTAGAHRDDSSVDRFDELKLDTGDVARIWIPSEDEAWMEWVHLLTLPVFEEDGSPCMTEKTVRKVVRQVIENTFLGSPICLGSPEVVAELGLDTDACPACAVIEQMLQAGISEADDFKPQRRFAIPVVCYNTQGKRSADKLQTPPGAKILVWRLSQWTYRKLDDARSQVAELLDREGGAAAVKFPEVDLAVQCESAARGQKIGTISPLRPAWRNDAVKAVIRVLWGTPENRPTEAQLKAACGRDADREWVKRDAEDMKEAWTRAVHWGDGGPLDASKGGAVTGQGAKGLEDSLDDLLGGPASAADPLAGHPGGLAEFAAQAPPADDDLFGTPAAAPAAPADDDLFGGPPSPPSPPPAAPAAPAEAAAPAVADDLFGAADPAPAAPAPAAVAPSTGAVMSFDDIIDGVPAA